MMKNDALIRFKIDFGPLDGVFGEIKYNNKYCVKEFTFGDEHHKVFNVNGIVVEQVVRGFENGLLKSLDIYIDYSNSDKPYNHHKHLNEIINFESYDHEITYYAIDGDAKKIKVNKDYVYDFIIDGVPVEDLDEELAFEADRFKDNNYVDFLTAEIVWAIVKDTTDQASVA